MSDIPADYRDRLNLREQIARIDLAIDEAAKFRAEQRKLGSESRKLDRDRWLAPLVLFASVAGGVLVAIITHVWK